MFSRNFQGSQRVFGGNYKLSEFSRLSVRFGDFAKVFGGCL